MPRVLTEPEFEAIKQRVLSSAPPNLSEDDFNRWAGPAMAQAIGEAENSGAGASYSTGSEANPDWQHTPFNIPGVGPVTVAGFLEGAQKGAAGYVKGLPKGLRTGITGLPAAAMALGRSVYETGKKDLSSFDPALAASVISDPVTAGEALAKHYAPSIKAGVSSLGDEASALMRKGATDPEALGEDIGEMTGNAMDAVVAGKLIQLMPRPIARGVGPAIEKIGGASGFPLRIAGAHQILSGNIPGGAAMIMAPEGLKKIGKSVTEFGVNDPEYFNRLAREKTGARTIDAGNIRSLPQAMPVGREVTSGGPIPYGGASPVETPTGLPSGARNIGDVRDIQDLPNAAPSTRPGAGGPIPYGPGEPPAPYRRDARAADRLEIEARDAMERKAATTETAVSEDPFVAFLMKANGIDQQTAESLAARMSGGEKGARVPAAKPPLGPDSVVQEFIAREAPTMRTSMEGASPRVTDELVTPETLATPVDPDQKFADLMGKSLEEYKAFKAKVAKANTPPDVARGNIRRQESTAPRLAPTRPPTSADRWDPARLETMVRASSPELSDEAVQAQVAEILSHKPQGPSAVLAGGAKPAPAPTPEPVPSALPQQPKFTPGQEQGAAELEALLNRSGNLTPNPAGHGTLPAEPPAPAAPRLVKKTVADFSAGTSATPPSPPARVAPPAPTAPPPAPPSQPPTPAVLRDARATVARQEKLYQRWQDNIAQAKAQGAMGAATDMQGRLEAAGVELKNAYKRLAQLEGRPWVEPEVTPPAAPPSAPPAPPVAAAPPPSRPAGARPPSAATPARPPAAVAVGRSMPENLKLTDNEHEVIEKLYKQYGGAEKVGDALRKLPLKEGSALKYIADLPDSRVNPARQQMVRSVRAARQAEQGVAPGTVAQGELPQRVTDKIDQGLASLSTHEAQDKYLAGAKPGTKAYDYIKARIEWLRSQE